MSAPPEAITDQVSQVVWQVKHRDMTAADGVARLHGLIDAARDEGAAAERERWVRRVGALADAWRSDKGRTQRAGMMRACGDRLADLLAGDQPDTESANPIADALRQYKNLLAGDRPDVPCCRECCEPCRDDEQYGYLSCCKHRALADLLAGDQP